MAMLRQREDRELFATHRSHPDLFADLNRARREVEGVAGRIVHQILNLERLWVDSDHPGRHHGRAVGAHLLARPDQRGPVRRPPEVVETEAEWHFIALTGRGP